MTITTNDQTYAAILDGLAEVLDRPIEGATSDSSLFNEIGLDSTGVLDLLMYLEEALDIEFDVEDLQMKDFQTIGTLADFVQRESQG